MLERLTTEVASLKLELATLVSAHRDSQCHNVGRAHTGAGEGDRRSNAARPDPSITPAAIVVVVAVGLLSWQLIGSPRSTALMAQSSLPAPPAPRQILRDHAPRIALRQIPR